MRQKAPIVKVGMRRIDRALLTVLLSLPDRGRQVANQPDSCVKQTVDCEKWGCGESNSDGVAPGRF